MYLKELTINGFKSFAKKGELEFDTPITAIVGPNGSGKSNVAEAFRFVLGEQSPSRMRGKKGEDLIWNGSHSASRANRASVSIVLNNETKVFPLDFSEITVERAVNRDGSNEYFVNGSRTRLRDVHELFAAANIGPSGHHIISQGEADRILTANQKERREMIEDALGLKVFQFKKQESEKKLEKTRANVEQVESLRREVKPHLAFLARQVKKVEKSVALREELKTFCAEYLYREDLYLRSRQNTLTAEKEKPTARLGALRRELQAAEEALAAADSKDEKSEALVELGKDMERARSIRQEFLQKKGQLEGKITLLTSQAEKEKAKAADDTSPVPYKDVVHARTRIEEKVAEAERVSDVSLLQGILRDVRDIVGSLLQRENGSDENEDGGTEALLASLKNELEGVERELAECASKEEALQAKEQALRASMEAEEGASREAERKVFELTNERRELETSLDHIEDELRRIEREREAWTREVKEAIVLLGSAASMYKNFKVEHDGRAVSDDEILSESRDMQEERRRQLEKMKIRLEELGEGGGDDVLKEYKDVKERDEFLLGEIEDLTASTEKLEMLIADLDQKLNEEFSKGLEKIDVEFNRFFTLMFGGGEAKLLRVKPKLRKSEEGDIEEEVEELAEGVEIDVKLPNKRVRGLDMLSGGERALTSIALIFAMSQVNPPLFVILDETDAALDEANSRRYGDMIESLAKRSQLILITHNRETMSRAGVLYGVTMGGDGVSKLLSVKLEEAVQVAK